jgi:hypothetical protein
MAQTVSHEVNEMSQHHKTNELAMFRLVELKHLYWLANEK